MLSLLRLGKKATLGLDMSSQTLKFVEIEKKKERKILQKILLHDLEEGVMEKGEIKNIELLGQIIGKAIKSNALNSKNVVLGIPARQVIIRQVQIPLMGDEDLAESLRWELDRYLPLNYEEAIVDYEILERYPEKSEMSVVLVGGKKEIIEKYLKIAEIAEFHIEAIEVSSFALLRALNYEKNSGTVVILNANQFDCEMIIVKNGLFRFSRVIAIGNVEVILREIDRSISFYRLQNREEEIEKIILSGDNRILDELVQSFQQEIKIEKADCWEYLEKNKAFDAIYLRKIASYLGIATGLALR